MHEFQFGPKAAGAPDLRSSVSSLTTSTAMMKAHGYHLAWVLRVFVYLGRYHLGWWGVTRASSQLLPYLSLCFPSTG
eukprot:7385492-Prymnesium_polylepis.1